MFAALGESAVAIAEQVLPKSEAENHEVRIKTNRRVDDGSLR